MGKCETADQTNGAAERHGASRGASEPDGSPKCGHSALGSAIYRRIPSKLGNILCVGRPPCPQNPSGGCANVKLPPKQGGAAERRGTSRSATEPGGTPKFGHSALEPTKCWWVFAKLPNILCFQSPPFSPTPKWGWAECEATDQTKGAAERRGTPRTTAEPDGSPEFCYSAPESAIFRWITSKCSNILGFRRPFFPNAQVGKGGAKLPTKQRAPRNASERYGT